MRICACCPEPVRLAAQPSSTFGSPDDLVTRGAAAAAVRTGEFAAELAAAVDGKATPKSIRAALDRAAARFDDESYARVVERECLFGLMLGALDSHFEGDEGIPLEVESFADLHSYVRRLADVDPRFVNHPMQKALEEFAKRKIVSPRTFKKLQGQARKRAFSVAGATNREMIAVVKDELTKQIADGADLRSFKKAIAERLESAGWVPANKSHVETIFRTNIQSAYNGGRYQQMSDPDVVAARPYWQVLTPNDGPPRQRPNHQAAHGRIFAASDAAFPDAFTPWDYNCRCRMRSLSRRQVGDRTITPGSWLSNNGLPAPGFGGIGGNFLLAA